MLVNPDAEFLPDTDGMNHHIYMMKNYCMQIALNGFSDWPNGLPSPDFVGNPTSESELFIGFANNIFTIAITFMFLHEIGHLLYGHENYAEIGYKRNRIPTKAV